MKSRDAFVVQRTPAWNELDLLLVRDRLDGAALSRLSALYREVCSDLMTARAAGFGTDLLGHLDGLAARAHAALYGHGARRWRTGLRLLLSDFPRRLRESAPFMLASALLFFVPFALGLASTLLSPRFAEAVLPPSQLENMAEMYSKSVSEGRASGTNAAMAGFYVMNNVGIAFRCFATGILYGVGSIFFLVYNGLMTGTVVGHVTAVGYGRNIFAFICGHSAYELGAIVIAGAAGLRLGYSLIATGNLTRLGSLRVAALGTVPLVVGAAAQLLIAAAVEAFWSPSSAPYPAKYAFGAVSLVIVLGFWVFAARGLGRHDGPERTASFSGDGA
ncbi:MAG TPA: stage II sporulation protein M [Polyangiaceae bacterium]